jgi:hypothetical protein
MNGQDNRQVRISDEFYRQVEGLKVKQPGPGTAARQIGSGGCGGSIIFGPDGDIVAFRCSGSCGFIDRILGRSCSAASSSNPGGGSELYCSCSGGWFDRLFG